MPPKRALNGPATFSPKVCNNPCEQPVQNRLLQLPAELQVAVWSNLSSNADRIALALTCKSNAIMFETLKPIENRNQTRVTTLQRLMILIRLLDWIDPRFRLCFKCARYCRRNQRDWGGDSQYENLARMLDRRGEGHKSIRRASRNSTIPKDAKVRGSRCPKCIKRERAEQLKLRAVLKSAHALPRKISTRIRAA